MKLSSASTTYFHLSVLNVSQLARADEVIE